MSEQSRDRGGDDRRDREEPRAHEKTGESRSHWDEGRCSESEREARREARHSRRAIRGEERHARKQRVLHTRISEQLSDDIRRLAEDLRVPTSNLVRNVLEEVFSVVESVSDDVSGLVDDVLDEAVDARDRIRDRIHQREQRGRRRRPPGSARRRGGLRDDEVEEELQRDEAGEAASKARRTPEEFPDVIGWQPLVLNQPRTCADCDAKLHKGERAFVGLTEGGLSPHTLCKRCTSARS